MGDYSAHDLVVDAYRMGWHDRHAEKDCDPGDALDMLNDRNMAAGGWAPVAETPITLDALAAAWEASDEATEEAPIREGDVVIVRHGGGFAVEPADRILSGQTHGRERILSRAPREPWQDLADDLAEVLDADARHSEGLARNLHNRGWRKGGEDDA